MADVKRSPVHLQYWRHTSQKKLWFTEFSAYREENKANLPLPLDVQKLKAFQLQEGLCPFNPLTTGSAPGVLDPAGGSAPRPQL